MTVDEDVAARANARLGTILRGKYHLDRVLGVGGMAVVYAATHRNKKRFAIKILHPEIAMSGEIRTRFLREGYVANAVEHAGAVAVLDDDTSEDGAAFLVMELIEGKPLDGLWEQHHGRLPVPAVLAAAFQLLDVLGAAHAKAIVHRDIKPANLFVTLDGSLKVLDFGIARLREATASGHSATVTGTLLGTPAYMAPEQALSKSSEIDGRTDIWAVGASMFTLLSGQLVHEGDNVSQIVVAAATRRARSLASVAPDMDRRVVEIVDRALAFESAHRWPSAAAMREAVGSAYSTLFGARIDRQPLFGLIHPGLDAAGATVAAAARPMAPPEAVAPRVHVDSGRTAPLPAPVGPSPVAHEGTTTARAVSTTEAVDVPGLGAARRRALLTAVVAVTLGGLALVGVLLRGGFSRPESTGSTLTAPLASTVSAAAPSAPESIHSGSTPAASVAPAPMASAPTSIPSGSSTSRGPTSRPSATTTTAPTRTAQAHGSVPPHCDPPYTLDANGEQHFKPECFPH
ncbi:MAG: serine/threonine-protein kinase [Polyangiaceae bacterium]|jgi:serine/threonine-protein kinase